MKKETKAAIAKFGVKLALKYTGAELLGDAAGIVADVGEKALPETTKTFLEAFSDTTADFFADKAGDLTSQYLTKGEKYVNFHLARGICKVWEDALTQSLPKNRAANSKYILIPQDSFQDFSSELEFFIEKFKQAQIQGNEALLLELFYDQNKSETYFYITFFEGVQDEKSAEEAYWATLEKTLIVWATREGKFRYDWKNGFPEEFKRELKKFFFGNLRYGLKEIFDKNEQFRNAFNFSVELITFDLIKRLPEKIREDIENAQSENRFYYSQLQERFSNIETDIRAISVAVQAKFTQSWNPKVLDDLLSEAQKQTSFQERTAIAVETMAKNHQQTEKSAPLPKYIAADSFPSHTNFFTGRGDVLKGIKDELGRTNRATLHGISGLGKTSVLLEFAKRAENDYEHIIFLRATKDNALNSFARLAEKVDESAKKLEKDAEKAAKFKHWLEANNRWLLLIDNVDVPSEVRPFLPVNLHGDILSSGNSEEITILGNEVTIKKMTSENGELLLYRRAKTLSDLTDDAIKAKLEKETEAEQSAIKNIVKEFDGLPLALNLAGAYIHKFNKKFADYENLYKKSAQKLLEKQDINDQYQNDSVAKAFSLNFETISTPDNNTKESKLIAQTAVSFLKTASFLHPEAIPLEILVGMLAYQNELTEPILEFELFLDEVFAKIAQFDLFEKDNDKDTFNIHRLVQLVVNNKIGTDEKQVISEQVLVDFANLMPKFDYFNKEKCERYFRHVEIALENADKLSLENEYSKHLYYLIGHFQYLLGNYQLAEKFQFRSWKTSEKVYGKIHAETARGLNDLALIYSSQGRYDKALKTRLICIDINKKIFGNEHPRIAQDLSNLANIYRLQDRYEEAIKISEEVLLIDEKTIGKNHRDYATHLNNLAAIYQSQGKYKEAAEKYEVALKIDEKTIGKKHPEYATRLNNLAMTYYSQKKINEAIKKLEEVLAIDEKTIGKEHPHYALHLNNLAMFYKSQSKYEDAIKRFEEILSILEKTIGKKHPDYATVLSNLASIYLVLGKYEITEKLGKQAKQIYEKTVGKEHSNLAITYALLAESQLRQIKFSEAIPFLEEALRIFVNILGENHHDTQVTKDNLEFCRNLAKGE